MYYNSIIETIGNTPLVKLNKVNTGVQGTILAKMEYFNPGNSMKDRIALKMIEDAESRGEIKPGGTIVEGTSGNTGMGLALAAMAKGYRCIFTLADKQSQEKIDILKALGAEVIVCPTNVPPEDPNSYYSVAEKLNKEIPNSIYPNQYASGLGVRVELDVIRALQWCDIANVLRIQLERQKFKYFPSLREYSLYFGINKEMLNGLNKEITIMHPGPINRGVELNSDVADSEHSIILDQVENGVAVRMAILYLLAGVKG